MWIDRRLTILRHLDLAKDELQIPTIESNCHDSHSYTIERPAGRGTLESVGLW
jgi:hypothetical protein